MVKEYIDGRDMEEGSEIEVRGARQGGVELTVR